MRHEVKRAKRMQLIRSLSRCLGQLTLTALIRFFSSLAKALDVRPRAHDDIDPPKYAVLQVVGYIKGKSAIHLARVSGERKCNFVGQHFWARGYFVSTVGRDEAMIRA